MIEKNNPHLGGCYHTGLAYCLGYDANGELELCDEIFTNLDTGLGGGAMAALQQNNAKHNKLHDVPRFIVALKPVSITKGDNEDNSEDVTCSHCEGKPDEDCCCNDHNECDDECCTSCNGDNTKDICLGCEEPIEECFCDDGYEESFCLSCDEDISECTCYCDCEDGASCDCDDELCEDCVIDTFKPMNAFERARWIKAKKNNG